MFVLTSFTRRQYVASVGTWLCLALCWASSAAIAGPPVAYTGKIVRVVDGDTVWLSTPVFQKPLKVRLQAIDAPEICQAGGVQAKAALAARLLGQQVTLIARAHDDYGRTLGTVFLRGEDMNRWLVANGHAWVYQFRRKKSEYANEFAQAKAARLGLFTNADALEPRVFRKSQGPCSSGT